MQRNIKIDNKEISYKIRKSNRARRLRIAVYCDTSIIVTIPKGLTELSIEKFLREKATWLTEKIEYFKKNKNQPFLRYDKEDYLKNKDKAFEIVREKVEYFNQIYKYKYNRISVKNQKTRWGSCSGKGNLNFNYKILYLPEKQVNYIIVHEICHLKEFNHSRKFWNLIAKTLPNYYDIKKDLKIMR